MSPIRYFIFHDKRQYGPFDKSEIRELVAAGVLTINDLIAPEDTLKYKPIAKFDLSETEGPETHQPIGTNSVTLPSPGYTEIAASAKFTGRPIRVKTLKAEDNFGFKRSLVLSHLNHYWSDIRQTKLVSRAFAALSRKISGWMALLGASFFVQYFLFSKFFSKLFELLFPSADPTGISFTGQVAEMIIVLSLSAYTIAAVAGMTIDGASRLYQNKDFLFKELFRSIQPKIPSFLLIIAGFSGMFIPLYMATAILPEQLEPGGKYIALSILLLIAYRLLLWPFGLISDNMGLFSSFRYCINLSYGQFKPIIGLGFFIIVIQIITDLLTRFIHPFSFIKQILNLYLLILATYFYKDLVKRRHYKA